LKKLAAGFPWASPFIWTEAVDAYLNMKHPPGYETRWFRGQGWCPARRHIHLCEQALDWGADLFCFVGPDQVHPEDMLLRLIHRIEHDNCDVITALVPTRGHMEGHEPFQRLAWKRDLKGHYLTIDPDDGELQPIDIIGSGVLMFPTSALERMRQPWFNEIITHKKSLNHATNSDTDFVRRLKSEAGLDVWVDTTIEVSHINPFQISRNWEGLKIPYGEH
jgi:hypothetical protein